MCPSTEGVKIVKTLAINLLTSIDLPNINPCSTKMCFHIHSGDYLGTFYSFRNSCGELKL
ncbi:hypothetical protein E2C01_071171 [Portunus trituberculatus]|uniref:Uncharacterized protein n=1 Tax=Portunus trituberculatus TaxID=210409 RepID=A0A5B7I3A7_PORTR|nr:hypothetical protein [Portunus trituberculatus]